MQYVQFLAILDSRVTDICESRNERLLRLDSPELAANTPPLHFQCRSVFSPVTTYDLKEMEKPGWKDAEGRTLEQLQDWSKWTDVDGNTQKIPDPAKGFGGRSGIEKPPTQAGGSGGGKKPPEPPKTSQLPAGDEGGEKAKEKRISEKKIKEIRGN